MNKQLVIIEKAENNYSAYSPCINGCIATGNTEEEVLRNFVEALVLHASGLQKWLDDSLTEISQLQTKIIRAKKLCLQDRNNKEIHDFQEEVLQLLENHEQEQQGLLEERLEL